MWELIKWGLLLNDNIYKLINSSIRERDEWWTYIDNRNVAMLSVAIWDFKMTWVYLINVKKDLFQFDTNDDLNINTMIGLGGS